jgi:dienelactone hydrolase
MNQRIVFTLLCMLLTLGSKAQQHKELIIKTSTDIANRLLARSFDSIVVYFDSTLATDLTAHKLEQNFDGNEMVYGKLQAAGEPVMELMNDKITTRTKLTFAKSSLLLSLNFSSEGKVSSMFISSFSGFYTIPAYVTSVAFLEEKVDFGKKGWEINGTLSYPRDEQKHPLVIIVHGSGPLDRDGSSGGTKIYRDLAWGLSTQGVCVFRYDKRSNIHGGKLFMESFKGNDYTPYDEIVEDVFLAIQLMKQNKHVDTNNIFVVGHSQGGMMLPLIAQKTPLKGMVLLAANARPIQDMLIEQMYYLYPDGVLSVISYNERNTIIRQANNAKKKKLPQDTPLDSLPFGVRASYWNYLNQYDQLKVFKKLKLPTLVLQGERDYQVTMTDYALWQKAAQKRKGPTAFISYPKLNHMFVAGEGLSKPPEYQVPANLDEKVVRDILEWIKSLQ